MAGFRPGLGFGGSTHVLLIDIAGALRVPGIGASGLLMAEGVAGVKTLGESVDDGDVAWEEDGREAATWYGCMMW